MPNEFSVYTEEVEIDSDVRTLNGCSAARKLLCAWSDRLTLRDELLGWPRKTWPHNSMGAVVVSASFQGFGAKNYVTHSGGYNIVSYEKALVTVNYETPGLNAVTTDPSNPNDKTKCYSEGIDFAADMITVKASDFYWSSDGKTLTDDEAPAIPFTTLVYRYSRHFQTKAALQALNLHTLVNCTNSDPWVCPLLPYTFVAETMLVGAPKISAQYEAGGTLSYQVDYEFTINPYGWNKFRRPVKASAADPSQMWSTIEKLIDGQIFKPFPPKPLVGLRPS